MRGMIAGLLVWTGNAAAHSGHGGQEGHFHAWGIEHGALFAVVLAVLVYAMKK